MKNIVKVIVRTNKTKGTETSTVYYKSGAMREYKNAMPKSVLAFIIGNLNSEVTETTTYVYTTFYADEITDALHFAIKSAYADILSDVGLFEGWTRKVNGKPVVFDVYDFSIRPYKNGCGVYLVESNSAHAVNNMVFKTMKEAYAMRDIIVKESIERAH